MNTISVIVLALVALSSIGLLKAYRQVSERELRRRAREGDPQSLRLYRAVAYGHSLTTLLWFVVGITNAAFFIVAARTLSTFSALVLSALIVWAAYVWLPARRVRGVSIWVAVQLAPAFAWLLNYVHPVIDKLAALTGRHWPAVVHTGLYDRDDLLELLHYQQNQPDSRVDKSEINIAMHALSFGDRKVRDIMISRSKVQAISADETIGPVLMNEVHQHGFSELLVYDGKKDNIIGLLRVQDLVGARAGGSVRALVRPDLHFVNEEQSLSDALRAVLKSKQHMFVVLNSFKEFVGVTTARDVLAQLVGQPSEGFDHFDDPEAVAAWLPQLQPQPIPQEMPVDEQPLDQPLEQPQTGIDETTAEESTELATVEEQATPEPSEVVE